MEATHDSRGQYSGVDAVQDEDADSMVHPGSSRLGQLPLRHAQNCICTHLRRAPLRRFARSVHIVAAMSRSETNAQEREKYNNHCKELGRLFTLALGLKEDA